MLVCTGGGGSCQIGTTLPADLPVTGGEDIASAATEGRRDYHLEPVAKEERED
jgi:hypothetical protein